MWIIRVGAGFALGTVFSEKEAALKAAERLGFPPESVVFQELTTEQ